MTASSTTSPPAIRAEGLSVSRGRTTVIDAIDFAVDAGSVTGLLGPSGSGKTTLMRAIVGVQRSVTGRLDVLGSPAGDPSLRPRVAYVTQAPSVYGDLTVEENMKYFGRVLGVGAARVADVIETVHLETESHRLVSSLSGGQTSRVSLGTALLGDPDLLVLDEPTVGLDPVLRMELWDTFHRLAEDGATLLVSSHVMDEANRCDRILVLRSGRVLIDDTPDGMRRRSGRDRMEDAFLVVVEEED